MKLYIHAGFHKAASSSFQMLCRYFEADLAAHGLHYPPYQGEDQHSMLMWNIQNGDWDSLSTVLAEARAGLSPDGAVLLSGEDFENCIVDTATAQRIEQVAKTQGFDEVHWVIVERDRADYLSSLYAEKSKHGIVINYDDMASAAEERGCFHLSTRHYNYIFVFDYDRFANTFDSAISGSVHRFPFRDFTHALPGAPLLKTLVGEPLVRDMESRYPEDRLRANERVTDLVVEYNYLVSAVQWKRRGRYKYLKGLYWLLLLPAILWRRRRTNVQKAQVRRAQR